MTDDGRLPQVLPRPVPEGAIPLISIEGTAYDCGRHYAEIAITKYPGFREYLDMAYRWRALPTVERKLVQVHAPHLQDLYQGIIDVAGPPSDSPRPDEDSTCTAFGVSGSLTLDGEPISGQTKDTPLNRVARYIVLRMRIKHAPSILVLAYPGEVLGHGLWSTGMSIFRNSLFSRAESDTGLDFVVFGLLALSGHSVCEAAEVAKKHGLRGAGNVLISDSSGQSLSVEWNAGGVGIVPQRDGIATHANHPEAKETRSREGYPFESAKKDSQHRMYTLRDLLDSERGRLTPQRAMMMLADHSTYPRGICKHYNEDGCTTTSAVVAEPTRGRLYVVRGQPCCNWSMTHTI